MAGLPGMASNTPLASYCPSTIRAGRDRAVYVSTTDGDRVYKCAVTRDSAIVPCSAGIVSAVQTLVRIRRIKTIYNKTRSIAIKCLLDHNRHRPSLRVEDAGASDRKQENHGYPERGFANCTGLRHTGSHNAFSLSNQGAILQPIGRYPNDEVYG